MDNNLETGRKAITNRLLDEGVVLVVTAAEKEGISIGSKTALRWCIAGIRGVRLESVKIGGRRLTSRQALRRFIIATQDKPEPRPSAASIDHETTQRVLRAYGLDRASLEASDRARSGAARAE